MNPDLSEIDNLCRNVQDYLDPDPDTFEKMSDDEWLEYREMHKSSNVAHQTAITRLMELLPSLSAQEIAEGYMDGCRLFQRSLSGYMVRNFNSEYLPVMMKAIHAPHLHTASNFLQSLADNFGSEISDTVLASLDIKGLREAALSIVGHLSLAEALPKVRRLTSDSDQRIVEIARAVLLKLTKT